MKKKQMNSERKKLVVGTLGIAAVAMLIVANLVFAYAQKQQRISDAQRPLLTQQEVDAAQAKAHGGKSAEPTADDYLAVPQLTPTPKPIPQPPKPTAQPTALPEATPQPPKPTLPPTSTVKPTPKPNPQPPMSESTVVPPPVKPTPAPQPPPTATPTHKDGDKRVNENGEPEIYMSGIGWLPDSVGGTYEPIG